MKQRRMMLMLERAWRAPLHSGKRKGSHFQADDPRRTFQVVVLLKMMANHEARKRRAHNNKPLNS
jgi:hypothetical protein